MRCGVLVVVVSDTLCPEAVSHPDPRNTWLYSGSWAYCDFHKPIASMKFDVETGCFEATIEPAATAATGTTAAHASTEQPQQDEGAPSEGGEAVVYVPWLHYRASDNDPETVALDVTASEKMGGAFIGELMRALEG